MSKRQKRWLRCTAVLCAVVLTAVSPAGLGRIQVRAATSSELQKQLSDLEAEAQQLNHDLAIYKDDLDKQQEYLETLNGQISNTVDQIEVLTDQINTLNDQIYTKEQEISEKQQQINDREQEIEDDFSKLQQRLRAVSKSGNMSTLQMLLDTGEYTDYLIKSKMMKRIADNDQKLMDDLEKEIQQIHQEKQKIENEKQIIDDERMKVVEVKEKADDKKAELDGLYDKANSVAKKLESSIEGYKNKLADNQQRQDEVEEALQELIRQSTSSSGGSSSGGSYGGNYGGGTMHWPVPAVRNVSSGYGYRWGTVHRGIDISEGAVPVYGQNVVAAADGQVIYVNNSNSWGSGASWGYGYCVIIDHGPDSNGNNITTLYAHNSRVFAYVGQQVTGGSTVISAAGATGDVTGPHLHFEVRVNGVAVDPIANGYISAY